MANILAKASISNYRFIPLCCIIAVLLIYSLSSNPSLEVATQSYLRLARDHGDELSYRIPNQVDESIKAYLRRQINTTSSSAIDPLKECSPTSQVRLYTRTSSRTGHGVRNKEWTIQTIDADGNTKAIGGDEFYITYVDDSNRKIMMMGQFIHRRDACLDLRPWPLLMTIEMEHILSNLLHLPADLILVLLATRIC